MTFNLEEIKNKFQKWIDDENYAQISNEINSLSSEELIQLLNVKFYRGHNLLHYLFALNDHDLVAMFFDKLKDPTINWNDLFGKQNNYGLTPLDMMSELEIEKGSKTIIHHIKDYKVLNALFEAKNYNGHGILEAIKSDVENETTNQNLLTSIKGGVEYIPWGSALDWTVGNIWYYTGGWIDKMSNNGWSVWGYSESYQARLKLVQEHFDAKSSQSKTQGDRKGGISSKANKRASDTQNQEKVNTTNTTKPNATEAQGGKGDGSSEVLTTPDNGGSVVWNNMWNSAKNATSIYIADIWNDTQTRVALLNEKDGWNNAREGIYEVAKDSTVLALANGYEGITTCYKTTGHRWLSEQVKTNLNNQAVQGLLNNNLAELQALLGNQNNGLSTEGAQLQGQFNINGYNKVIFKNDVDALIKIQKATFKYNFLYTVQTVLTHDQEILWTVSTLCRDSVYWNSQDSECWIKYDQNTKHYELSDNNFVGKYYKVADNYVKELSKDSIGTEITVHQSALTVTTTGMSYYIYAISSSKLYAGGVFFTGLNLVTDGKPVSATMKNVVVPVVRYVSGDRVFDKKHVDKYIDGYTVADAVFNFATGAGMCFILPSKMQKAGCLGLYGGQLVSKALGLDKIANGVEVVSDTVMLYASYVNPYSWWVKVPMLATSGTKTAYDATKSFSEEKKYSIDETKIQQKITNALNENYKKGWWNREWHNDVIRKSYNEQLRDLWDNQYKATTQNIHKDGYEISPKLALEACEARNMIKEMHREATTRIGQIWIKLSRHGEPTCQDLLKKKGAEGTFCSAFAPDGKDMGLLTITHKYIQFIFISIFVIRYIYVFYLFFTKFITI